MRRRIAAVVLSLAAVGASAFCCAAGAAAPPSVVADGTILRAGERNPLGIVSTPAGRGLRRGARIPARATVKVRWLVADVRADESTALTIRAPKGQAIVGATSQLVSARGRVLATWHGTTGEGPVLIDGQYRGRAGVLVTIPETETVPPRSVVVTYALFRAGGRSIITR